jgi:3-(3-hydroxy-phenyl)propionate hydroxylase
MPSTYTPPVFAHVPAPELATGEQASRPVIIVGAGPVGLACALELSLHGVPTLVLDDGDTVSTGSRAICYAKRTLEVLDRYGCGEAVVERGISWRIGKVFHRDRLAYSFNLQPEAGHRRPAFVNLQQYHLEEAMLARLHALGRAEVRWQNRVTGVAQDDEGVTATIQTPEGVYEARGRYLIACDGARSPLRGLLGLDFVGQVFRDRFLIADVHMRGDFPTERWFWFDPPFHPGQSVLLHRQADDVWRIDFQLGWDADPEEERKPERVIPRIRAMLGDDRPFELEWVSVYTFQCRRLERFLHGRVIFAGDAAHQVSPFGARGANSGIQDADNLGWKLARVLAGISPASLLDSYERERTEAADENILNSTRATDFITPKSRMSRMFRDAVLDLAVDHEFARRLVNSGRLSLPTTHLGSPLSTPDRDAFAGTMVPGASAADAPVREGGRERWWLDLLGGEFCAVYFAAADAAQAARDVAALRDLLGGAGRVVAVGAAAPATVRDDDGLLRQRYDASPGTLYLLRPDQHVAARWRHWSDDDVATALRRAQGVEHAA